MVVLCDQFLYERLRKVCERMLVEKITIRKCGDILDFACIYNCELLRHSCVDFICQNLARVLTYRALENCEAESLKFINAQYRKMFKDVFDYRVITPDTEAIDDDLLRSFVDGFEVDLDYRIKDEAPTTGATTKGKTSQQNSSTRQHERDAISNMMKSLSFSESEQKQQKDKDECQLIREAQEVDEKLHESAKSWMRVVDKKEQKKKSWREGAINTNKIIQQEKPVVELVALSARHNTEESPRTPTEQHNLHEVSTATNRSLNLADCADFTPPREKLSQKQRKRLSSTSAAAGLGNVLFCTESTKNCVMETTPPNAWGLTSSPNDWGHLDVATGSSADPDSFANMLRDKNSTPLKSKSKVNDFMQIQAEERKQRDDYERLRNKSLALTQIEETAITELRAFYNVDNVTDEIITIERKPMPRTMNFAVWQKN